MKYLFCHPTGPLPQELLPSETTAAATGLLNSISEIAAFWIYEWPIKTYSCHLLSSKQVGAWSQAIALDDDIRQKFLDNSGQVASLPPSLRSQLGNSDSTNKHKKSAYSYALVCDKEDATPFSRLLFIFIRTEEYSQIQAKNHIDELLVPLCKAASRARCTANQNFLADAVTRLNKFYATALVADTGSYGVASPFEYARGKTPYDENESERDRRPESSVEDLGRTVVLALRKFLHLTRAAIYYPVDRQKERWTHLWDTGYPKAHQSPITVRGQGLSGLTLSCEHGSYIESRDIESDRRWSKRHGNVFVRNMSEQLGKKIAFLGVPLFISDAASVIDPRGGGQNTLADGALVLMRSICSEASANEFADEEIQMVQTIASQISFAFSLLRSREHHAYEKEWLERLSRLEKLNRPDGEFFNDLVHLLGEWLPGVNLLLSVMDPYRTKICGVGVAGRFPKSFADQTLRPIGSPIADSHPVSEEDLNEEELLEDSLSVFVRCRERTTVFVPDSETRLTPLQAALRKARDSELVSEYGVSGGVLYVPLWDTNELLRGVLIATTDTDSEWHAALDTEKLHWVCGRLTEAIGRRIDGNARRARQAVLDLTFAEIAELAPNDQSISHAISNVVRCICSKFSFHYGVVYALDQSSSMLRGVAGFNVNLRAVTRTAYELFPEKIVRHGRYSASAQPLRTSLALSVFLSGTPQFVAEMADDKAIDQSDRIAVGIPEDCSALAIPVIRRGATHGVLILCTRHLERPRLPIPKPTPQFMGWLQQMGVAVAGLAEMSRSLARSEQDARASQALSKVLAQTDRLLRRTSFSIGAGKSDDDLLAFAVEHSDRIGAIVRDAANVFNANITGLFIADAPAQITTNRINQHNRGRVKESKEFLLVAGTGYSETAFYGNGATHASPLKYLSSTFGLTSSVLWSGTPQMSDDVESDPRWSRSGEHLILDTRSNSNHRRERLRAWLGVPVLVREGNKTLLFGALTFTRFRHFPRDRQDFDSREVATARSVAAMIAVILKQRYEISRSQRDLRNLVETFTHDETGKIINGLVQTCEISHRTLNQLSATTQTDTAISDLSLAVQLAYEHSTVVDSLLRAYAQYVRRHRSPIHWDLKRIATSDLFDPVFSMCKWLAKDAKVALKWNITCKAEVVSTDKHKVRYLIVAMLRNALSACIEAISRGRTGVAVEISVTHTLPSMMRVDVSDSGTGVAEDVADEIFFEGVSSSDGGGLGLAISKAFVDTCDEKDSSIRIEKSSSEGATFTAVFPAAHIK